MVVPTRMLWGLGVSHLLPSAIYVLHAHTLVLPNKASLSPLECRFFSLCFDHMHLLSSNWALFALSVYDSLPPLLFSRKRLLPSPFYWTSSYSSCRLGCVWCSIFVDASVMNATWINFVCVDGRPRSCEDWVREVAFVALLGAMLQNMPEWWQECPRGRVASALVFYQQSTLPHFNILEVNLLESECLSHHEYLSSRSPVEFSSLTNVTGRLFLPSTNNHDWGRDQSRWNSE